MGGTNGGGGEDQDARAVHARSGPDVQVSACAPVVEVSEASHQIVPSLEGAEKLMAKMEKNREMDH